MAGAPHDIAAYADRIERELRGNILPFWMDQAVDRPNQAFFGSITNALARDPSAERGALLTSRILWTFSAAYARYRDRAYLDMAQLAYDDLNLRFRDREHGGYFWSVSGEGGVLRDRKQVYGQAFAIYALSEFHAATGLRAPLDEAVEARRLLEAHARSRHGGYLEAFSRDWKPVDDMRLSGVDLNEPKSQNTHLHVMEAYTRLYSVWPEEGLRASLAEIVELMLSRVVDPSTGHLGLFFADDWTPRSDRVSYGHDIEAAWLLTWASDVLKDSRLGSRTRPLAVRIADATLREGVDSDGGVFNQGGPGGPTDTDKEWWPQAEAVVGFLNAHEISGEEMHLRAALRSWDFIERRLIDREHGEWFRGVRRDGTLLTDQLKVSFWKCPYHNGRAGLEAARRLRALGPRSPL